MIIKITIKRIPNFLSLSLSLSLQGAAISVCQYLAAEVHQPEVPATPKKHASSKKKTTHTVKKPVPKPSMPQATPPSPIVTQLMEMGFPRRNIEYAIEVRTSTIYISCILIQFSFFMLCGIFFFSFCFVQMIGGSSNPEQIVSWLIDHPNIELPELRSSTDKTQDTSATFTAEEDSRPAAEDDDLSSSSGEDEEEDEGEEESDDGDGEEYETEASAVINLSELGFRI